MARIVRQLNSIFFSREDHLEYVRPGSQFRRVHSDRTVETAEVISVHTDTLGIPHVRYKVDFLRPNSSPYIEGPRVLAVRAFFELYQERVGA
jgi:hypothetical protein